MQLVTEYTDPSTLSGYARAALEDYEENAFTLSRWLPSDVVDDLFFRFEKGGGGLVEAANFRAYDAESDIGTRAGAVRVSGMLPPISRKIPVSEYEQIKERNLVDADSISDKILNLAEKLTREVGARVELARGDALFNGGVTIEENGVSASVDYGRDPDHSVTADVFWDDPDLSKPFDDLTLWTEVYNDTNGTMPEFMMMPDRVSRLLRSNAQLCRMSTTGPVPPAVLSTDDLNELLREHDLPQIVTNDARVSFQGVATRVTPADKLCLLPAPGDSVGKTLWGTPVEARDSQLHIPSGEQPGVLALSYKTEDPQTLWTRVTAIVLPVVADPDRTFVAKVV
ncbi:major capsid protein [Streptomyces sp. NPDC017936]|uniref:major capsid protein n=1 Tax=Streptomyces sp. NPDC017936 TaxID=3365016 RepID=UPI00379AF7AA